MMRKFFNKTKIFIALVMAVILLSSSALAATYSAKVLTSKMRVYPGAVSPLGLIFDEEKKVRLLIDEQLLTADRLAFHPCDNTATVAMRGCDFFEKFLTAIGREFVTVEIHDFAQ